jgi:hypothetical protein
MLGRIQSIFAQKSYRIYQRPYELNIVGVRAAETRSNSFDDQIHVFYRNDLLKWEYHIFKATTDPGTYWLKNPASPQGTAILAQGQYVNAYQIGWHQNKYKALVQRGPVNIIRDYDRNAVLDFFNGKNERGIFGINIHRALVNGKTKFIDKFSAGCQVFESADDFAKFLEMCEKHKTKYGNQFTYTLIDTRAIQRETLRRVLLGLLSAGMMGAGYWLYSTESKSEK